MKTDRVLMVDDEANVLTAGKRLLRKEAYRLEICATPEDALHHVVTRDEYAVIIADERMPGFTGSQFLEKVRSLAPDSTRIIMTGYADTTSAIAAINRGGAFRYIAKPWDQDELKAALRDGIDDYHQRKTRKRLRALAESQNLDLRGANASLEQEIEKRTAAIAQLNARLHESFMGTIQVLGHVSEMHSALIGSHSKRVAALSGRLAGKLDIEGQSLTQICLGGMLHDIGEIGIPREIMDKDESALTAKERQQRRQHVLTGESLLRLIPGLDSAARLVRHHHERFDGRGYPDGLVGRDIPLGARIIAVADSYDVALNRRKDFADRTPQQALASVNDKGARHDPQIVDVLAACLKEMGELARTIQEVEIGNRDLRCGMRLSRDLLNPKGLLLLSKDTTIQPDHLELLAAHDAVAHGPLFIYRTQSL